jgi:acyl-CoA dehydrogenase
LTALEAETESPTMFLELSPKTLEIRERLLQFFDRYIYPNEVRYNEELEAARKEGKAWQPLPLIEELKAQAQKDQLWNL